MAFLDRRTGVQLTGLGAVAVLLLMLTGCGNFFVYPGSTGMGSTSTGTGDYVYVGYNSSGSTYIGAYQVGSGALTAIAGSPFSVTYTPLAMAVSPNDGFLYVAAEGSAGVFAYTIGSNGALSNQQQLLPTGTEVDAMTISPDGNYLLFLGLNTTATQEELVQYTLNTSTGGLNSSTPLVVYPPGTNPTPCQNLTVSTAIPMCGIAVSPSNNYVAVAAGNDGTGIFPYSSNGGISSNTYSGAISSSNTSSDSSVAFDNAGNLYIGRTSGVATYTSLGSSSPTSPTTAPILNTLMPHDVTLSTNYGYLYTADVGANNISTFSVSSSGVLTPLTTPTQVAPTSVTALGVDRSGTYLLAAGYNTTNGLQMFTISSSGLSAVASEGTGNSTTYPVALAMTH